MTVKLIEKCRLVDVFSIEARVLCLRAQSAGDFMSYRIFIISFNRLTVLRRSVDSFLKLNGVTFRSIHIIDTGSTLSALLDYYEEIKRYGASVSTIPALTEGADGLNRVSDVIELAKHKFHFDYFAVTDPDISFEDSASETLEVYKSLLDAEPSLQIVGPMLRIEDVPAGYPARSACFKLHREQFWHKVPRCVVLNSRAIHYQIALIDTTFGLMRRNQVYKRLQAGVRVYRPYEALHLDWYFTPENIPSDQLEYIRTANRKISHWAPWFVSSPNLELANEERDIFVVREAVGGQFVPVQLQLPQ